MADTYLYRPFIDKNHAGWLWGFNSSAIAFGRVGDNSELDRSTPKAVLGGHLFQDLTSTATHTLGCDYDGNGYAWGYATSGQMGNNTTNHYSTPIAVCGGHNFVKIYSGLWQNSYGLDTNGQLWGWGYGREGELGNNATSNVSTPVAVCGGHVFIDIFAANNVVWGIDNNNDVWFWGYNGWYGGDGTGNSTSTPKRICGSQCVIQVSAMRWNRALLDSNGTMWVWGQNGYGELGRNNTTGDLSSPLNCVCGNHTFCKILLGYYQDFGLDNHGQLWGWGYNSDGSLEDNTTTNRSTPVAVCGNHTFCAIITHRYGNAEVRGMLAIDYTGKMWGWGNNSRGDVGDNTTINRSTPVAVCGNHTFLFIQSGTIKRRSPGGGVAYGWSFTY